MTKDFRTINIHVPKNQVQDTVQLYALKNSQRKLSLRFLAYSVLSLEIQKQTHDSIEDARTALRLFKKYLEYEDAGIFEQILNNLQVEGVRLNFKVPSELGVGGLGGRMGLSTPPISRTRSEAGTPMGGAPPPKMRWG